MNNNPIGVFDSGIGGLTVVKEIMKELPGENIIYIGDTARVPYGTRGKDTIIKFALELVNFLIKRKVKILVVACNTISSTCLHIIEKVSPVPVLGVIEPVVDQALKITRSEIIGLIGTPATISSRVYEEKIKTKNPKIKLLMKACPLLVPLIEEGEINNPATKLIVKDYLQRFKKTKMDTLILGCTHYPILKTVIQETVGTGIALIDSAKPTAKKLRIILEKNNLLNDTNKAKYQFFVTDDPQRVYKVAKTFLGKNSMAQFTQTTLS